MGETDKKQSSENDTVIPEWIFKLTSVSKNSRGITDALRGEPNFFTESPFRKEKSFLPPGEPNFFTESPFEKK